jgi:hypothetical protein
MGLAQLAWRTGVNPSDRRASRHGGKAAVVAAGFTLSRSAPGEYDVRRADSRKEAHNDIK